MIATVALANIYTTSHNMLILMEWEHLRSTFLENFIYSIYDS